MHIIEKWGSGIPRVFEDAQLYGLGEPEIKDFGTSFRISIKRRAFETDPFGVVDPSENGEVKHQSSASNNAELFRKLSLRLSEGEAAAFAANLAMEQKIVCKK